jgi:hypothetical protein
MPPRIDEHHPVSGGNPSLPHPGDEADRGRRTCPPLPAAARR